MSKSPIRNVPPPPGTKPASAYTRFIPREELHDFAAWNPGSFGGEAPQAAPEAEPEAPAELDWEAQVAAARQAGYQDGYRDGLVALDGFKQSFAAQMSGQVGELLDGIDRQFQDLEAQLAATVAETAVRLARQVLRTELAAHPQRVAHVAAEAVEAVLLSARQITLHVHSNDLPLVAEHAAEALQARGARLVADDSLARGGCRVESDLGAIDARIGERWAQASAALGVDLPWTDEGESA